MSFPKAVFKSYMLIKKFQPELVLGFGILEAISSKMINKPVVVFTDSEPNVNKFTYNIQYKIFIKLVNCIITPESFRIDLGEKQIKVNSFKEMAYLHPNYLSDLIPIEKIEEQLNIDKNDKLVILRFNAFSAVHDFGIKGFSEEEKIKLVDLLSKYSKVFICSETILPEKLKSNNLEIEKKDIHSILERAHLLITDTQTMATEAAILGVPVVRYNTFVGKNDMGNFIELENKYGLMFNFNDVSKAIEKSLQLIKNENIKNEWNEKRHKLLEDKTDIANFMVEFIENYRK